MSVTLPARILLQIREGVPNLLHEFKLTTRASYPVVDAGLQEKGATLTHEVSNADIAEALIDTLADHLCDLDDDTTLELQRDRINWAHNRLDYAIALRQRTAEAEAVR